jgi:hypothetical protein
MPVSISPADLIGDDISTGFRPPFSADKPYLPVSDFKQVRKIRYRLLAAYDE